MADKLCTNICVNVLEATGAKPGTVTLTLVDGVVTGPVFTPA